MQQFVRRVVTVLACLTLGGVALAQSAGEAHAGGGDYDKQQTTQNQQQQQKQTMTTKEKAEYFDSWSEAEEPGQAYGEYASSGLLMVHSTLGDIIQQTEKQPIGGGPAQAQQKQAMQGIEQNYIQLKNHADNLANDRDLMQHPRQFHEAANSVVSVLESLQQARFSDLKNDVKQVRQSVDKIQDNKPLAAQKNEVSNFFQHTSDVISKMSDQLEKSAVGGGPEEQQDQKQKQQDQQQKQQQQSQ